MAKQFITGIDIGSYEVKVMIAEKTNDHGGLPLILGSGITTSRGLRHGYILNRSDIEKSIGEALRTAEKLAKVKVKKTYLSVGGVSLESIVGSASVMISRADTEITQMDISKCIQLAEETLKSSGSLQNKKILQTTPILFKIDGKEVLGRPEGMKGGKLEARVLFVTCLEQHLNDLVQAVEEIGLEIEDVIPAPFAAAEAILNKTQRIAGCVLANIGAETVSIIVYENDKPISVKVFPIGGTDITNDIALGLQIPLEEAEQIKLGAVTGGNYSRKKLDEIVIARLSDIFELIENHLKKIGKNGLLPAGVILTGGSSGISTIEDLAKAALRLPSQAANLKTVSNIKQVTRDSTWVVAYGLCIIGSSEDNRENMGLRHLRERSKGITEWFKQFLP
jgi:cell division protein FtsA